MGSNWGKQAVKKKKAEKPTAAHARRAVSGGIFRLKGNGGKDRHWEGRTGGMRKAHFC